MGGDRPARGWPVAARLGLAAAVALVLVLAAAAALYLSRMELARRAALRWAQAQGVEADVRVRALGPTGLTAQVRLGPAGHPDLTVEQAEISYSLSSFLGGKGLQVSKVRLDRPVLNGRWRGGRLELGSIDRLLAALKAKPGVPAAPLPRIEIRSGLVRLATDYGPAAVSGDADLDQGRLDRLDASLAPTTLRLNGAVAAIKSASVQGARTADRLRLGLRADLSSLGGPSGRAQGAQLNLLADLGYAALAAGRIEGRATGQANLASAEAGGYAARAVTLDLQAPRLSLAAGPRTGSALYHLRLGADEVRRPDLRLSALSVEGAGRLALDKAGLAAEFTGGANGSGASAALGPPARDDAPVLAAAKRSLVRFRFAVDKAELSLDHGHAAVRLLGPARVRSASGGALDVKPAGAGYSLTLAGGGLPDARADLGALRVANGALGASARVAAAFSLGLLDRARVKADGRLTLRDGALAFAASSCADVAVERLDFGANSARDFTARLCPGRAPMLTAAAGRWSLSGLARGASATVPQFQAALSEGSGSMRVEGRGKDVGAAFVIDQVKVADLSKPLRFQPAIASGRATLAKDLFTGGADVRTPRGAALAHAEFRHAVTAMTGHLVVSAPALTFARGGLQPTQLSPLTAALGEPVSGRLSFEGRFDWAAGKTASSGRLTAENLSFRSAAGPVTNLSGAMAFSSLAPLVGSSVGPIRADRLAALVPLTDVSALARIDGETATISEAQGAIGGGHLRLNAVASLAADRDVQGQVVMDKVQVHDLVAGSPFSDKVSMTAQISGRMPFRMAGGKLRIAEGAARADGPGRLSINRATFNPGGAAVGPATQDNLTTFGYQAMEDLAFQSLDAAIDSQPDGKLRIVLHVAGKHDPPTKKEIRLGWRDLLGRKILSKPMPLPSNTGVNLTLDTTLNLDNLIKSREALDQQLGSASVQASGAIVGANTSERPQ